jgi:cobalamin synthase
MSARREPAVLLAARFLFPRPAFSEAIDEQPAWRRTARWLTLWGLVIGIGYAAVYRGSWKWFGEYQKLRLLPPIVLLMVDLGWCGYRQIIALATLVGRKAGGSQGASPDVPALLALTLFTLFKFGMLLTIPFGAQPHPADWREYLGPLYPAVIYRPLILMPLWERWGLLLAMCIGRVAPQGSARLKAMAGGLKLSEVIIHWLLIATLTVSYISPTPFDLAYGVVIALAVLVLTYLINFALTRQAGGQNETTIWATGLVAELAFLVMYLPIARAIYSY